MESTYSILIVEDDSALRTALALKFKKEKFTVYEAQDGQEGLDAAITNQPSIILLDIIMPVKDGISMLKELRQNPWGEHVPVIMLTNLTEVEKIKDAMAYHADQYLVKSNWKLSDVVTKVKERLLRESATKNA
jgi:DNA-binding response OmpR family regulator